MCIRDRRGVADAPAYTLIIAPGRWRQYVNPSTRDAGQISASKIADTTDLWHPLFGCASDQTAPIVWRGASETETLTEVRDLLDRVSSEELSV